MHTLAASSNPNDVTMDAAVRLLAERAVLTRAVCRELQEADEFSSRRSGIALGALLAWVNQHCAASVRVEPYPGDGLDEMMVPESCRELFAEIKAGAVVAKDLFMLFTADTPSQQRGDENRIRKSLAEYWHQHPTAARAPNIVECMTSPGPKPT